MRYGYFDDQAKEYVITRPDTPTSWSNYLGTTEYGAIITNNAGGYGFYRSGARGRFLRLNFNSMAVTGDSQKADTFTPNWLASTGGDVVLIAPCASPNADILMLELKRRHPYAIICYRYRTQVGGKLNLDQGGISIISVTHQLLESTDKRGINPRKLPQDIGCDATNLQIHHV